MLIVRSGRATLLASTALALPVLAAAPAHAQPFTPGDILISSSTYQNAGAIASIAPGSTLPNNSVAGGVLAVAGGGSANANPLGVFFNSTPDANFGVTSTLTLTQYTTAGTPTLTLNLPAASATNANNGIVTSFPSKSEGALTLSPNGQTVSLMGYSAPVGAIDVSNAQTPGAPEAGNTDTAPSTYRAVATINASGQVVYTQTNAFSGNNGRAAVLLPGNSLLMIGNAGNGNGGNDITNGTGAQFTQLGSTPLAVPNTTAGQYGPGSTEVGFFQNAQVGAPADKTAKDSNFRGLTIYNNTVYTTKGSGGNGIDTVYQIGNAGSLVTLPATSAPTAANPLASNNPISILPGFSIQTAKAGPDFTPFSTWFANPTTMYVSDEGSGDAIDVAQHGGIQKWSLVNGTWVLDYTLRGSLVGGPATNFINYGAVTTTGLRQINGLVNPGGTATIFGVTATTDSITDANGNKMDSGADPNQVVDITDVVADTLASQVTTEDYSVFAAAQLGTVYRGVSLTPAPEPTSVLIFGSALTGLIAARRRRAGE